MFVNVFGEKEFDGSCPSALKSGGCINRTIAGGKVSCLCLKREIVDRKQHSQQTAFDKGFLFMFRSLRTQTSVMNMQNVQQLPV